jgi:hypothetical protein
VHANAISQFHALVVLWAQVPMGIANCFLGVCVSSGCPHSGAARGELCFRHLWLVDQPPSVCEMVWRVAVLAVI